jgi:replicative DNA helicase
MVKLCIDQGLRVIVFNREMTNVEMLKKLIVLESGKLSYLDIRLGYVGDLVKMGELEATKRNIETKYSADKFAMFDNMPSFDEAAAQVKKFKPDIIFDDYIQLIMPDKRIIERRLQLEKLVNSYKWLAKKQKCVCVLLSQLNRGLEIRGDGRPKLSDLAESGAIEQVAENVLFVYYDHKVNMNKSKDGENVIELIGSKVRYGVSGSTKLGYEGDMVKIHSSIDEYRSKKINGI